MSESAAKRKVKIGLIQMRMGPDIKKNLEKALRKIDGAARRGAQIVCLSELFRSEYFCQTFDPEKFKLAEPIPGETTGTLSEAAKRNNVVVVASLFEKADKYYNSAVVIDADGSLLGTYRKMHIPNDPEDYMEDRYFAPGNLGFKAFSTAYGKIGVLVCWDQWFPEAARATAMEGAEIIFCPTAIGWDPNSEAKLKRRELSAWRTTQMSHGIDNNIFIASVNRVGLEGNIRFWGSSFVSGPFGEVIAKAGSGKEGVLIAECDLSTIESTRRVWNFLERRRTDAYGKITSGFGE